MYRIIEEKNAQLNAYRTKSRQLAAWLAKSDLWYWVYSCYEISGKRLGKRQIADILDGKIVEDAPVDAYNFIHGAAEMQKDMKNEAEMQSSPDVKLLMRWADMLYLEAPELRDENPIVYEWELIPLHFNELSSELESLFRTADARRLEGTDIERIARLHLEFLKLYAFGEHTAELGLVLMLFDFVRCGYPVPMLNLSDREYNTLVADYVKSGDVTPFTEMLQRALINRIEDALTVCYQLPEKKDETI